MGRFYDYLRRIGKISGTFEFELMRANDMYRLQHMLSEHIKTLQEILNEVNDSVKKLEG